MNSKEKLEILVQEKYAPGMVAGSVDREGKRKVATCGRLDYTSESARVRGKTAYDLASVTKFLVALVTLRFIADKNLTLEVIIKEALPEFTAPGSEKVTLRHLLTFNYEQKRDSFSTVAKGQGGQAGLELALTAPLESVGRVFCYQDTTAIVLSLWLETISGLALEELLQKYLCVPLGLKSTTFKPQELEEAYIAPTEMQSWRRAGAVVNGQVHNESSYIIERDLGINTGAAGIFSSVSDLLALGEVLLANKTGDGEDFLPPEHYEALFTQQLPGINTVTRLGNGFCDESFVPAALSDRYCAKSGFTGTLFVVDLSLGRAMVVLSNYTWPQRKMNRSDFRQVNKELIDILSVQ